MSLFKQLLMQYSHPDQSQSALLKSEAEILMALSIERKYQNYTLLRAWDQMRAEELSIHRKTIDQLTEYTQASLQLSTTYISVIKQFLSDKYDQFMKYSKFSLTSANIQNQSQIVRFVYSKTSQQLKRLHGDAKSYQNNALNMAIVIQNLLKKVELELIERESELLTLKEEVNSRSEELLDINDEAYQTCVNLSDIYHKEKAGNVFKSKQDFYALSEIFMMIADEQTQIQKELGEKIIELFKWGEQTKFKRHEFLKGILIEYYTTHEQMHKIQTNASALEAIKNGQYKNDCQVEDILDRQSRKDVNRMLGEQDNKITMTDLHQYINSLKFKRFEPRNLVLKQTKAKYKNENGEEFDKYLVITVDAFLHFMVDKTYDVDTVWTIKLDKSVKLNQVSDTQLEITKNYASVRLTRNLLHLKKDSNLLTINMVFASGDNMLEFIEFINKIIL